MIKWFQNEQRLNNNKTNWLSVCLDLLNAGQLEIRLDMSFGDVILELGREILIFRS